VEDQVNALERNKLIIRLHNDITAVVGYMDLNKPELALKWAMQALEHLRPLVQDSVEELRLVHAKLGESVQ
jgi:hypothetical protein